MAVVSGLDRRGLLAGLGGLALAPAAWARTTATDYPALKAFIDGYVASRKLPGGVVAIKRGDRPVEFLSAGTLAFDTQTPAGLSLIHI